jgi:iron complex transport system ATP-binding protein
MSALTVEAVSFGYRPGTSVLRGVSLTVRTGEFLSLVGPNGSGKTTLLRLLDRIFVPQSGRILLGGRPLGEYARVALARRIAFVPQESGVLFPFTVKELVLMGRSPHARGTLFANKHDLEVVDEVMSLTDIGHLAGQPVTALSGGERQRVIIARALAQEPAVILLDEPNAHLDLSHQLAAFALLRRMNTGRGLTVVSVSHDLNLAATFSDRVAVLVGGRLTAVGAPRDVLTSSLIREAFQTHVLVDPHPVGGGPRITVLA